MEWRDKLKSAKNAASKAATKASKAASEAATKAAAKAKSVKESVLKSKVVTKASKAATKAAAKAKSVKESVLTSKAVTKASKAASEAAKQAAAKAKSVKESVLTSKAATKARDLRDSPFFYHDSLQIIKDIDKKLEIPPEDLFKLSNLKSIFGSGTRTGRSILGRMLLLTSETEHFYDIAFTLQLAYKDLKWDYIIETVKSQEKEWNKKQAPKIAKAIKYMQDAKEVLISFDTFMKELKFEDQDFLVRKKEWQRYVKASKFLELTPPQPYFYRFT